MLGIMKITRRELAGALAAANVARSAGGRDEPLKRAIAEVRKSTAAIARYDLPMATEPAFKFHV